MSESQYVCPPLNKKKREATKSEKKAAEMKGKTSPDGRQALLDKFGFSAPEDGNANAVFNQRHLCTPRKCLNLSLCDGCFALGARADQDVRLDGLPCLLVPLCPSCVHANRRMNQVHFYDIAMHNIANELKTAS